MFEARSALLALVGLLAVVAVLSRGVPFLAVGVLVAALLVVGGVPALAAVVRG